MVETINPVVYGGPRSRWRTALALHVLGATGAAGLFGAALGAAGSLLGAPWGRIATGALAGLALLYLLREATGLPVPVLEARRQVPDWWRTFFSRNVTAFIYGAGVGIGFLTYLGHGTLLVVSAAALASGRPLVAALLVAPFGLARALSVGIGARTSDPAMLVNALAGFARRGWPRLAHGVALGAVVVAAVLATRGASGITPAQLAPAVLALTFAWAAAAKVVAPSDWRRSLSAHGLSERSGRLAAVAVPLAETSIPVLVLSGLERIAGAAAAVLLVTFSLAVLAARARRGNRLPCGCFGGARLRDYRAMLARNALLAVVAVTAGVTGANTLRGGLTFPTRQELLPAAVVLASVATAAWTLGRGLSSLRRAE